MQRHLATVLILACVGACTDASAGAEPRRLRLDLFVTNDSDDAVQQSAVAKLETHPLGRGQDIAWGIGAGARDFRSSDGSESFKVARADYHAQITAGSTLSLRGQKLYGDDWSPLLSGLTLTTRLSARWYLEASADRDLVDTVLAIRNRTTLNSYTLSVDYAPAPGWTLVGAAISQNLSDDNDRRGRVFRLIYAPGAGSWNLEARARRIDSDFRGIGYFSPRRLEDALLLGKLSWSVAGERFVVSAQAGGGAQRVDGDDAEALYRAELRGRGWLTDRYGLEGRATCSNTGDLNAGPAEGSYYYCEALLSLIGAW